MKHTMQHFRWASGAAEREWPPEYHWHRQHTFAEVVLSLVLRKFLARFRHRNCLLRFVGSIARIAGFAPKWCEL